MNKLKETLETHLRQDEVGKETTGESILNMVNKYDLTEEELNSLPVDGVRQLPRKILTYPDILGQIVLL